MLPPVVNNLANSRFGGVGGANQKVTGSGELSRNECIFKKAHMYVLMINFPSNNSAKGVFQQAVDARDSQIIPEHLFLPFCQETFFFSKHFYNLTCSIFWQKALGKWAQPFLPVFQLQMERWRQEGGNSGKQIQTDLFVDRGKGECGKGEIEKGQDTRQCKAGEEREERAMKRHQIPRWSWLEGYKENRRQSKMTSQKPQSQHPCKSRAGYAWTSQLSSG